MTTIARRSYQVRSGGGWRFEAGAPETWYRWVGLDGDVVGMTTFGASAPVNDVMKHFGFTLENVVAHALKLIER